jgi:hypothetical protein
MVSCGSDSAYHFILSVPNIDIGLQWEYGNFELSKLTDEQERYDG